MSATVRLVKTAEGYATADGRFTVTPKIMGDSPRSKGKREWKVSDAQGGHKIVHALYRARDYISGQIG